MSATTAPLPPAARLTGLVAATHTPFHADGSLNLAVVERQAEHLLATGVSAAFVGGTTGESSSLTVDERLALAGRWGEVTRGSPLRLVVHVGANCLVDAEALADHAESVGAAAVSALAPSYFKPRTVELLVECCARIAAAAPGTPFYYYDIPPMTGVSLSAPAFLAAAEGRIPTLAGIKFSNPDLTAYQMCLAIGRFDLPWGIDEYLLAAMAVGAVGGVGSSYNFAAPIFRRMMAAAAAGDLPGARAEQYRAVRVIDLLAGRGYMAAAKATMGFLGVDVGPARLPNGNLAADQGQQVRRSLEEMGFFAWVGRPDGA